MPFLITLPKSAAKLRPVPVQVDDGMCKLQEVLLACDARPKDVLDAFGFDKVQTLLRMDSIWELIQATINPSLIADDPNPTVRMMRFLLIANIRPAKMLALMDLKVIHHLLVLERDWDRIKANYQPPDSVCAFCGDANPKLRCSECRAVRMDVRYCNKKCQKAGWPEHKKTCGKNVPQDAKDRIAALCMQLRGDE